MIEQGGGIEAEDGESKKEEKEHRQKAEEEMQYENEKNERVAEELKARREQIEIIRTNKRVFFEALLARKPDTELHLPIPVSVVPPTTMGRTGLHPNFKLQFRGMLDDLVTKTYQETIEHYFKLHPVDVEKIDDEWVRENGHGENLPQDFSWIIEVEGSGRYRLKQVEETIVKECQDAILSVFKDFLKNGPGRNKLKYTLKRMAQGLE